MNLEERIVSALTRPPSEEHWDLLIDAHAHMDELKDRVPEMLQEIRDRLCETTGQKERFDRVASQEMKEALDIPEL